MLTISKISPERKAHIDQLAYQAFLNTGKTAVDDDHIVDLQIECCAMEAVLEQVTAAGDYINFYSDIDRAFELLLNENPAAFRTYKMLTTMLRIFAGNEEIAMAKCNEIRAIVTDLDVLELEAMKGGRSC